MKNYKFLLFDLDDTLLDFKENERRALISVLNKYNVSVSCDMAVEYHKINRVLWDEFEHGKISREQIWERRFEQFSQRYRLEIDYRAVEEDFRRELCYHAVASDGALDICRKLSSSHLIYIVTNGFSETQRNKLALSGLDKFISGMITSEDAKSAKPSLDFFNYAFLSIHDFKKSDALIIGDSLRADIYGGNLAGVDTCYFNPHMIKNISDIIPTYEISSLCQLADMDSPHSNEN